MSTVLPNYPFDPTGIAATNLVTETQAIESRGMFDHYYVIPRSGPFFAESVKLRLYPIGANVNNPAGGQLLEEGVHYNFGYHMAYASHTIGKPVYGAITFYDRVLKGQLRMEFQTLGGEWVLDDQTYNELLLNVAFNPRIATWEQVVELPKEFPVVNHDFNIDDFVGMGEVVDQLEDITEAIKQSNEGGLIDHIENKANPHDVTKDQVGLGLVDNYPTAAPAEATDGLVNNRFMTPLRTKQLIDAIAMAALDTHMADISNPHGVTKAQVGLGSVQNYATASQAESEAGASNARYMTPLRTREAIDAIVGVLVSSHISNLNNPHQVTKAQVGLGNVPNIGVASDASALQGIDDSGMITPRLLSLVLTETVGEGVTDHIADFANPHGVTKTQIGLSDVQNYPPASEFEARDATANNRYMTPLAVRQAINELVGDNSNAHVSDLSNPHQVTKAQVGLGNVENNPVADQAEAIVGVVNNRFMTPLRTKEAIDAILGIQFNSHVSDISNPHGVTAAQVGTYDQAQIDALLDLRVGVLDVAYDSDRLFGMDQATLQSWIGGLTVGNATKLDGKTFIEVKTDILASQSSDSARLEGRTYDQLVNEVSSQVSGGDTKMIVPGTTPVFDTDGVLVPTPEHWVKIGSIPSPGVSTPINLTLMVTGSRMQVNGDEKHSTSLFELSVDYRVFDQDTGDSAFLVGASLVKHLSRDHGYIAFGYTVSGINGAAVITLYLKSAGRRDPLVISELSGGYFVLTADDFNENTYLGDMIASEPAGIVYPEVEGSLHLVDNFATATPQDVIDGVAVDKFVTPLGVSSAIDVLCNELITVIDASILLFD